ncbi:bifunctional hydroxymethylpyrimidine kinase/phosphomethylpyrimidine kinase [Legionella hackeliae]|uniref:hydroxymethylpyrimidine kinase n=1 Tax=Legionella hackeliae TaxID=449 RepID=A0A0A8URY3_LEGHA|nr:bifunctional hydroxymethylpyrimidine kinase/phosphomethylpyrimidine kinase [Legionella hackeliae]KTD14855.1 bifunctional hydroxy-methylpyrimidine kinase and hydroxy-phosphomethylpyrimidine kinase [Legionella hackeliae]CEK09519.1 Phosphomethylpyrimidine kinase [Legionella hackeliae]STX49426.1 bifunctional hydroxy-methylpyrimidine kinase and hydroxy-phosphomethylpyrimidine kinase [Legionella hackeliae]
MKHKALSIAGFDGSGGAGIQADLKTFSALGCYGMTVLTALPIQNTCGVKACYEIPVAAIHDQLDAIFSDIRPDCIKIGMLFNSEIIEVVATFLQEHAQTIPIILDPVLVAKSGDPLLLPTAIDTLKEKLIPLATLITPNIPEAESLLGITISNTKDMSIVSKRLLELGAKNVLLKGGHLGENHSNDYLQEGGGNAQWFPGVRISSKNTHGTGCTLSAAIASGLALGLELKEACQLAKQYVSQAIVAAKDETLGLGHGPVHHFYHLWPTLQKVI